MKQFKKVLLGFCLVPSLALTGCFLNKEDDKPSTEEKEEERGETEEKEETSTGLTKEQQESAYDILYYLNQNIVNKTNKQISFNGDGTITGKYTLSSVEGVDDSIIEASQAILDTREENRISKLQLGYDLDEGNSYSIETVYDDELKQYVLYDSQYIINNNVTKNLYDYTSYATNKKQAYHVDEKHLENCVLEEIFDNVIFVDIISNSKTMEEFKTYLLELITFELSDFEMKSISTAITLENNIYTLKWDFLASSFIEKFNSNVDLSATIQMRFTTTEIIYFSIGTASSYNYDEALITDIDPLNVKYTYESLVEITVENSFDSNFLEEDFTDYGEPTNYVPDTHVYINGIEISIYPSIPFKTETSDAIATIEDKLSNVKSYLNGYYLDEECTKELASNLNMWPSSYDVNIYSTINETEIDNGKAIVIINHLQETSYGTSNYAYIYVVDLNNLTDNVLDINSYKKSYSNAHFDKILINDEVYTEDIVLENKKVTIITLVYVENDE